MTEVYEKLSMVDPSERVLLLAHCLRPSQTCPGKQSKKGLVCPDNCAEQCVIGRLRRAALELGYKGVCIAAGGAMALRFVAEQHPKGIIAVACDKELSEGVQAVREMASAGQEAPVIMVVPLLHDGCVDTEVDEESALEAIALGCSPGLKRSWVGAFI